MQQLINADEAPRNNPGSALTAPPAAKPPFPNDCAAQGKNRLFTGGPQPGLNLIWAFCTPGLLSIVSEHFQVSWLSSEVGLIYIAAALLSLNVGNFPKACMAA